MPYIEEKYRLELDNCINEVVLCLKHSISIDKDVSPYDMQKISNQDIMELCGNLNYTITRICGMLASDISYSKIAIITGVLENVKQEFYRRLASKYEDKKIAQNGDVKEFKK